MSHLDMGKGKLSGKLPNWGDLAEVGVTVMGRHGAALDLDKNWKKPRFQSPLTRELAFIICLCVLRRKFHM